MKKTWIAAAALGWLAFAGQLGQVAHALKVGTHPGRSPIVATAMPEAATRSPGSVLPSMHGDEVTIKSIRWFGENTIRLSMKRYHDTEKNVLCYVTYVDWTGNLTVSSSSTLPGFPAPGISCVPVTVAPTPAPAVDPPADGG